jgi:tocopherol cyclase
MQESEETRHEKPILFQGSNKKDRYFEGWYFKQVCEQHQQTISFIPGISLRKGDQHAFIQVIIAPQSFKPIIFALISKNFRSEVQPFAIGFA